MRIEHAKFYCYIPGAFLKSILEVDEVLHALMAELGVPGKPAQLKRMPQREKLDAIELQAVHHQRHPTSPWRGVELPEILASALWRSGLSDRKAFEVFYNPKKETDLAKPVAAWLAERGLKVYAEVATGTKRPDMIGYKEGGWLSSPRVVTVELKNDVGQLKRGLDQMTTFGEYSNQVYLACSAAMAADYLGKHASAHSVKHWDPEVLNNKLRAFGFGLLLIWTHDMAIEVLAPTERSPAKNKLDEVLDLLKRAPEFRG